MDGTVIFDLHEVGHFTWTILILGLAAASLLLKGGLFLLGKRDEGGIYGSLLGLAVAMGILAVVIGPVKYWNIRDDRKLLAAFDTGQGTVVEGGVEGYEPPRLRDDLDTSTTVYNSGSFSVGAQAFSIEHGNPAEDFLASSKRVRLSIVNEAIVRIGLLP